MKSFQEFRQTPSTKQVEEDTSPTRMFEHMVETYLASNPFVKGAVHRTKYVPELELRFGSGKHSLMRPISKIDYGHVVQAIYSAGFKPDVHGPDGVSILRAQPEFIDARTHLRKISNIRTEIVGVDLIQEYCRTNSLQKLLEMPSQTQAKAEKINFTQKVPARYENPGKEEGDGPINNIKPVDFPDFGFRVSYQLETYYSPTTDKAREIISSWSNSKKTFRYLNRVRFAHPDIPIFFDISIVKKSKTTNGGVPVPQYTIQDSGVLTNPETYEIEMELDNQRVNKYNLPEIMAQLRKCIRLVLGALQESRFPIGFAETRQVLAGYLKLIHQDAPEHGADVTTDAYIEKILDGRDVKYKLPRYFVGPSSYTLQMDNIVPLDSTVVRGLKSLQQLTTESTESAHSSLAKVDLTNTPNIRNYYTVTDKADGERRLLYVASNGRVYMITPTLNVIFTGTVATKHTQSSSEKGKDSDIYDTLLDGEYITYDKTGAPLHSYMAFDLYYLQGKSVRKEGFYPINDVEVSHKNLVRGLKSLQQLTTESTFSAHSSLEGSTGPSSERAKGNFRFLYLDKYVQSIKLRSITAATTTAETSSSPVVSINAASQIMDRSCGFDLQTKHFYVATDNQESIFQSCQLLLAKIDENLFPYNTDGIIFTPASMGVGADSIGKAGRAMKDTWVHSFKWKPPQYNTIDFLVTVQHDSRGKEEIKYLYEAGRNVQDDAMTIPQYKTLILKCGFDPKKHGYLNPYSDVLQDRMPKSFGGGEDDDKYKPVIFQPTDPYDENACFCHVNLKDGAMMSEEGEYFEANMIVEFRYDMAREGAWKWVPLRVRYDKTAELRSGQKNYGNSYHVANSNWSSIHHPITSEMLATGDDIPTHSYTQNDVYYNRKTRDTNTQALRNFHNLYVKRALIVGASNPNTQLIDFACGKAGDLSKWRAARLRFVLGIDISRDNIQNRMDGACARYLGDVRKYGERNVPKCLFFAGDSGKNIRTTGDAFVSATERGYVKAIFGQGNKDPVELPPAVFKHYGTGETGFDVGSCQFAIHYFFENELTLHTFLRNVSDCIRVGGYFIGTTYDGKTLFDQLRKLPKGGSWTLMKHDTKIAEITKDYDATEFPDTEQSIGYQIQVYQETINKVFPEYLVNFTYFIQLMDQYGFQLIPNEEAKTMGLSSGTGMFEDLYKKMMHELRSIHGSARNEYGIAAEMSEDEKKISFLNRYFVFKKMHTVNTENLYKIIHNRATVEMRRSAEAQASEVSTTTPTTSPTEPATAPTEQEVTPITVIIRTKKLKNKLTIPCAKTLPTVPLQGNLSGSVLASNVTTEVTEIEPEQPSEPQIVIIPGRRPKKKI